MITRVWGKADKYSIIFKQIDPSIDTYWEVSIPPDMEDGMYATEIWAENTVHKIAHWVGMLYITNSKLVWMYVSDSNYEAVLKEDNIFEYTTTDSPMYMNTWIVDGRLEYQINVRSNKNIGVKRCLKKPSF